MKRVMGVFGSLLVVVLVAMPLAAQELDGEPRFRVVLEGSHVPVYEGDATVGPVSSLGISGRVGAWVAPTVRVDGFFTHAPDDDDPFNRSPEFNYWGVLVGTSNLRVTQSRLSLVLEAGYGWIQVDPLPEVECDPAEGCFAEGGPNYQEGTDGGFVLGGGLELEVTSRIHLVGGARWQVNQGRSEAGLLTSVGVGFQW